MKIIKSILYNILLISFSLLYILSVVGCTKNVSEIEDLDDSIDKVIDISIDKTQNNDDIEIPSKLEVLRFWANNFSSIIGESTSIYDYRNILVMDFDKDSMPELLLIKKDDEYGLYYYDIDPSLKDWSEFRIDNIYTDAEVISDYDLVFAYSEETSMNYILYYAYVDPDKEDCDCYYTAYSDLSFELGNDFINMPLIKPVKYASYETEYNDEYISTVINSRYYDENNNEVDEATYCNELTLHNYTKSHSANSSYVNYIVEPEYINFSKTKEFETGELYLLFDSSYKSSILTEDTIGDYKDAIDGVWYCSKIVVYPEEDVKELENESIIISSNEGIIDLSVNLDAENQDYKNLKYNYYYEYFSNSDGRYYYVFEDFEMYDMVYIDKSGEHLYLLKREVIDGKEKQVKWFFEKVEE